MNWTGGTRARHNRPSSDTTRLQKRYFAKVRASHNSIPNFAHASPHPTPDDEHPAGSYVKRKKATIPAFDIVLPRNDDASSEGASKRRRLLETRAVPRDSTPLSSIQSLRDGKRGGDGLKTKKQLLLEKDDWVCTALARPLVLKHRADNLEKDRRTATTKVTRPPDLDFYESLPAHDGIHYISATKTRAREYNPTGYPSLEKIYEPEDRSRRFGGAFRDLSDGGYVQIGGSTQCGMRSNTSQSVDERLSQRGMSDISEETMLFDLDEPRERCETSYEPFLSPEREVPERDKDNRFERGCRMMRVRDNSESLLYYNTGSRRENLARGGHITGKFPSSPLAPYSQNINRRMLSEPTSSMDQSSEPVEGLTGEVEEASMGVVSSSPSTTLSTIYLRPETGSLSREPLSPTISNFQTNQNQKPVSYGGYPTRKKYSNSGQGREPSGVLSRLLQEEIKDSQSMSLMAYASSSGSSSIGNGREEGESWMLGSNISPKPLRTPESKAKDLLKAHHDDWGKFLKGGTLNEVEDIEKDDLKDDIEAYLNEAGIWEKQLNNGEETVVLGAQCGEDGVLEDEELYEPGYDQTPMADISNTSAEKNLRGSQDAIPSEFFLWPGEKGQNEPWKNFVIGSSNTPSDRHSLQDSTFHGQKPRVIDRYETPPQLVSTSIQESEATSNEIQKTVLKDPMPNIDLDGEEDRAWRMFVFDGLDNKSSEEEIIKPLKSSKLKLKRKSSLKPVSQFAETPDPCLPSLSRSLDLEHNSDFLSTAGATAGSGSFLGSENDASGTGSSPAKSKSKYFNGNSSSPFASLMSLVHTKPKMLEKKIRRRNKKKTTAFWPARNVEKKALPEKHKDGEDDKSEDSQIDEIEECR